MIGRGVLFASGHHESVVWLFVNKGRSFDCSFLILKVPGVVNGGVGDCQSWAFSWVKESEQCQSLSSKSTVDLWQAPRLFILSEEIY